MEKDEKQCPRCGEEVVEKVEVYSIEDTKSPEEERQEQISRYQADSASKSALIFGIISIPIAFISPIVAIVLGIMAIVFASRARRIEKNGNSMAGLICGILGILAAIGNFLASMTNIINNYPW